VSVKVNLFNPRDVKSFDLSIILPVYNECESISEVCRALLQEIDSNKEISVEVIFIDDASSDSSVQIIKSLLWEDCRVYRHLVNLGHQQALLTGLVLSEGRWIGMMDSDGQHPVNEIFKMFYKARESQADLVQGLRISRSTDSYFKKFSARIFYTVMRMIGNSDVIRDASDFRIISHRCKSLLLSSGRPIPFRFSLGKFSISRTFHYFEVNSRIAGKSKYSLRKMNSLAISSIVNFSDKPLRFIAVLGIITSLLSAILLMAIFGFAAAGMTIPGWASLATLISIFGALNLLSLGIIAIYISVSLDNSLASARGVELLHDSRP